MTKIKIRRKREDLGTHNQNHRQTVIKTDRQIHREKDNTLARKPIGSHYVGGIHCETHTHTHLILFKNNLTEICQGTNNTNEYYSTSSIFKQ